jgi:hypothetical protein
LDADLLKDLRFLFVCEYLAMLVAVLVWSPASVGEKVAPSVYNSPIWYARGGRDGLERTFSDVGRGEDGECRFECDHAICVVDVWPFLERADIGDGESHGFIEESD